MTNKEIIQKILDDIDYYKKNSRFIYTIELVGKKLNNSSPVITFMQKIIHDVDNETDEKKIAELNSILTNFINKSEKKYIKKINTTDYDVYEYDTYFKWFIKNKKLDITALQELIFKNNTILKIYIDGYKRQVLTVNDDIKNDIRNSEKTEIWFSK